MTCWQPFSRPIRAYSPIPFPSGGVCWCTAYMTDPLSLGASAVGKIGSAVAAGYTRGRDERRDIYKRFQEAVVSYVVQFRDSRISGLPAGQQRPYVDARMKAITEYFQALEGVRVVGNEGPRAAAESVREAIGDPFDAATAHREELTKEEADECWRALESFTAACRPDLGYQPLWWQIWRPSWWRARRNRAEERLAVRVMQAEDVPVGPVGHDAVFGASQVADGQAITLHQAAELFLGEELKSLSGKEQGALQALPTESLGHQDSRDPAVAAESAGPSYALLVWQKAGRSQRDEDGRLYGETGQGEEIQRDADRKWWRVASWRRDRLRAIIFIADGKVSRVREVHGVDEETTGDSSSLAVALDVSAPLTADEIEERLPTLHRSWTSSSLVLSRADYPNTSNSDRR